MVTHVSVCGTSILNVYRHSSESLINNFLVKASNQFFVVVLFFVRTALIGYLRSERSKEHFSQSYSGWATQFPVCLS